MELGLREGHPVPPVTILSIVGDRDAEVWDFIAAFLDEHGFPPTVREIGAGVGMSSPGTVHAHLVSLEARGYIKKVPGSPRAIRLVSRP
jgi:repressor LexA